MSTRLWLARQFECPVGHVEKLYHKKEAMDFILVWTQFELLCFDGHFRGEDKKAFVKNFISYNLLSGKLLEYSEVFHKRYKSSSGKLKELYGNMEKDSKVEKILKEEYSSSLHEERLYLLVAVIVHHRNNLFYGNRGLKKWLKHGSEITRCIEAMKEIIDISYGKTQNIV